MHVRGFPRVIVFVGTVGAGKSTQMRLLASKLSKEGRRTKVAFLKTNHLLAFLLVTLLAKVLAGKRKDVYPIRALLEERPAVFKRLFRLWLALDFLSIVLMFLTTIYIPLKMDYIVLVEEYIPATISDYIYISKAVGSPLKTSSFMINFLLRLMRLGYPTQVIFLDAKTEELKSRWKRRGSLDEKPDYLQMQRTILLSLSKSLSQDRMFYIDTSHKTIEEIHRLIVHHLINGVVK